MQVILLTDLRNKGRRGDVVQVKPGFARNYLLPKQFAVPATPGNTKWFQQQRAKIEAKLDQERDAAAAAGAQITGTRVEISKRAGESETLYGSVTPAEIIMALKEQGIDIDRRMLDLSGGIKTLGEHIVKIDLHPEVTAEITINVIPASN